MAQVVAGFASSHASTFRDPTEWDERRVFVRRGYVRRFGQDPPPEPAEVFEEALEGNMARYQRIHHGLESLRRQLEALQPATLVLIGDDQNENFREDNLPQFAIYVGEEAAAGFIDGKPGPRYRCDAPLARAILEEAVEGGFDLASSNRLGGDVLMSHAHWQVLRFLDPDCRVLIVPIFVNAIHTPAPNPARCYAFGQALQRALESRDDGKRVVIYASGGLSHFTHSYPWPDSRGPHPLGWIDVEFDREVVRWMAEGRGSQLAQLTSRDLSDHGDIEMRQWIVLLGALGDRKPQFLTYEPFFRAVMGMAVGYWDVRPDGHG